LGFKIATGVLASGDLPVATAHAILAVMQICGRVRRSIHSAELDVANEQAGFVEKQ
jgi:hypothetical protein